MLTIPDDEPDDARFQEVLAEVEAEAAELEQQRIGELASALDLDYFAECGLGNLAADALRERMEAEAALVATGQFHRPLDAGPLTLGELDRACFSSANPCVTAITGAELQAALERGLNPEIYTFEHGGLRGSPYGIPQISGLRVTYRPFSTTGNRVLAVEIGEAPLDPGRTYRLAHTDAETISDLGYLILNPAWNTHTEVPTILREVLADYIRDHSPVPSTARRPVDSKIMRR